MAYRRIYFFELATQIGRVHQALILTPQTCLGYYAAC
jgi:hypothetical protein